MFEFDFFCYNILVKKLIVFLFYKYENNSIGKGFIWVQ